MYHFGDPCIHCNTSHDDVAPGPCKGDPAKAKVLFYCVSRQAYENPGSRCDTILCAMSDGSIREESRRPEEWWWASSYFKEATVLAPHEFQAKYFQPRQSESACVKAHGKG